MYNREQTIVRELAKQVAEIADTPVMAERRELWRKHNRLQKVRPMILIYPEGAWNELVPDSALQCADATLREFERRFRMQLYRCAHFDADNVVTRELSVPKVVRDSGWGLAAHWHPSAQDKGARGFDPVINSPQDLDRLKHPVIEYDEKATAENLRAAQDLLGDILDVRLRGVCSFSFHIMSIYTALRGLEQVMMDMYENPGMLHDAMAFFEEGFHGLVRQHEALNLFGLNNDNTAHSSGGVGYTDELPAPGFTPSHVRPCDMWASAEAQEMAQVSPEHHEEFILQYEKRLLRHFGLNGYGCCEDLTAKLDYVLQIPGIRRISIAPWANVDRCAERLGGRYIFSWKPNPTHLVGRFDPAALRAYIDHTVEVARQNGCVLEMILKDTHTCENHPERFDEWCRIARAAIAQGN